MDRLKLYKELKEAGFHQGGRGSWIQDPNSDEKYYIPEWAEIMTQFVGNPEKWANLTDTLARVWIENTHV